MRRPLAYGLLLSVASLGAACCSHTEPSPSPKPSPITGATADGATSSYHAPSYHAPGKHVSRDPNGWTVVVPSSDSRIIYVSSSRGDDRHDGKSQGTALKTLAAATKLLRPGHPDHLLLKSGDIWYEPLGNFRSIGGPSAGEPMVITSYGAGARPQLRPDGVSGDNLLSHTTSAVGRHLYIIGLEFYDSVKDPRSPDFRAGAPNVTGISWLDGGDDLLIEDCYFHFLAGAIVVQYNDGPSPQNVTIRRNVVTDQYAYTGHAQGIFLGGIKGTNLIEENIFDHNAWNDEAGVRADVFNHHIYVADSTGVRVENNLFGRDGSMSLKFAYYNGGISTVPRTENGVVYNNFFFEGEVGLSITYGGPHPGTDGSCFVTGNKTCFTNFVVSQNVMSQINRDPPTGRAIGWGIDAKNIGNSTFDHNLFTDFSFTGNAYAIALEDDYDNAVSTNNTVHNNVAYRFHDAALQISPRSGWSGIKVLNNTIQDPDQHAPMVDQEGSFTSTTYSGNTYSPLSTSNFAKVNGATVSYANWLTDSGETGSQIKTTSYPDPRRNLETYLSTLKPPMTLNQFYTAIRGVSKANWHREYTAPVINDYIRAGFGLPAAAP